MYLKDMYKSRERILFLIYFLTSWYANDYKKYKSKRDDKLLEKSEHFNHAKKEYF